MAIGSGRIARWWLDRPLRTKGLVVLALPMLVLVITVTASYVVERHELALRQRTQAVNTLASQSEQVLTLLLNAETGVRGYALTGDASFLAPYQQAVSEAPGAVTSWLTNAPAVIGQEDTKAVADLANRELQRLGGIRQAVSSGKSSREEITAQHR